MPQLMALAMLMTGAFFFACRSCEYSKVKAVTKTKLLTIEDLVFSDKQYRLIANTDPFLSERAHFVSITFKDQKNGVKMDTRTQERTDDPVLCPVRCWASVVTRVLQQPFANQQSPVNYFFDSTKPISHQIKYFTADSVTDFLRLTCKSKPDMFFGYNSSQISTHSLRSGAAMALFLADEHPYRIMLLGRWLSCAFIDYIRPQVMNWSCSMSGRMLKYESFLTDPTLTDMATINNSRDPQDPMVRGDARSTVGSKTKSTNGPNPPNIPFVPFHLFH